MNIFNRLLVILLDVCVLVVATLALLVVIHVIAPDELAMPTWAINQFGALEALTGQSRFVAALGLSALIIGGLTLAYFEMWPSSFKEKLLSLKQDALGEVSVSLNSIREIASRTAGEVEGVMEASSQVKPKSAGLRILSRVSVQPTIRLSEITVELQERIKTAIENHLDYPVAEVHVVAQLAPLARDRRLKRQLR